MSLPAQHFYIDLRIKDKSGVNTSVTELQLTNSNLGYITITEDILSLLPKLEMVINDVGGLIESFPLLDNDVMSIVISQYEDGEPSIEMDFIISDYEFDSDNGANHFNKIKIVGYAYSEDLFVPYRNRSFNGNSVDVLKKIAKETKIEFDNPHNISPNDKMIWYQNNNNYNFIRNVLRRSYISNDGVFFYSNTKNKFVYTSFNSEIEKEENFKTEFDEERVDNFLLMENEKNIMFFNAYDVVNLTGLFNKISNYAATFGFYDLKGKYKGEVVDNIKKLTQLYNKNKRYDGQPSIFNNVGMFGNGNVFKEYPRAIVQNLYFRYNLFSTSLVLNINSMTDVKLFDKVKVGLPSPLNDDFNEVYSGYYVVGSITHNITSDGVYQKKVLLCRNGINKSDELKNYEIN